MNEAREFRLGIVSEEARHGESLAVRLVGDGVMTRELAGHSTANVTHHLKGIQFPASKAKLLARARNSGAGQDVLEALECFPEDEEFESLADVLRAYRELDQAPQTGIIDIKP